MIEAQQDTGMSPSTLSSTFSQGYKYKNLTSNDGCITETLSAMETQSNS